MGDGKDVGIAGQIRVGSTPDTGGVWPATTGLTAGFGIIEGIMPRHGPAEQVPQAGCASGRWRLCWATCPGLGRNGRLRKIMAEAIGELARELESLLKLRSIPFGMKLFERRADMEAIPRIRRPKSVHTLDQVVAQAARLGWTVGITADDLVGAQCRAVVGLGRAKDEAWSSGKHMTGVWFSTLEDARAHQAAMHCVEDGRYEALAVAPLASGRLDPPDIALFYATPGAMMYFINGLQWSGYKSFEWGVVGESACADSWGRALKTRQPSLSIPCFAERRYGGVNDDEMLMALPPEQVAKAIAGMTALAKNGFRYPFPQYGIQQDVRDGMAKSYPDRAGRRKPG
jgi:uncharacterized protein (DUF169 family)